MASNLLGSGNFGKALGTFGTFANIAGMAMTSQRVASNEINNQGIVDRNTLNSLGDLGRDVRRFSSSFTATRGVVTSGQSALSVKSASLANAERQASNIIEQGQAQKREIVSKAKGQQNQLLGGIVKLGLSFATGIPII